MTGAQVMKMKDNSMDHFAIQISKEVGELVGKIEGLTATVQTLSNFLQETNKTFSETNRILNDRLSKNEKEISNIALKVSYLGLLAGGVGSFIMSLIMKLLFH